MFLHIIIFSLVLFATGDVLAQTVTMEKGGKYNCGRMTRAAVFGSLLLGPLAHTHFNFIEWLIVKKVRQKLKLYCQLFTRSSSMIQLAFTGTKMALSKMFIDQFTYWTIGINIVYLFRYKDLQLLMSYYTLLPLLSLPLMAGQAPSKACDNVTTNLWPVLKANWCLWPLAQV